MGRREQTGTFASYWRSRWPVENFRDSNILTTLILTILTNYIGLNEVVPFNAALFQFTFNTVRVYTFATALQNQPLFHLTVPCSCTYNASGSDWFTPCRHRLSLSTPQSWSQIPAQPNEYQKPAQNIPTNYIKPVAEECY